MRAIVHLSDLHFGALNPAILGPTKAAILREAPDVIAVSGDLTQRARPHEFREAVAFLQTLPGARLIVPGNHDIPLYDVVERLLNPLGRFQKFVTADLMPVIVDEEIAMLGLNTTRVFAGRRGAGRLAYAQMQRAVGKLRHVPPGITKFVVTHHPFDVPEGLADHFLVGRAAMAMAMLATAGADVLLAGHLHVSHIGHTAERYRIAGHSALAIQAGTLSRRGRGELNAFNVIRLASRVLTIERKTWDLASRDFITTSTGRFERSDEGWSPS